MVTRLQALIGRQVKMVWFSYLEKNTLKILAFIRNHGDTQCPAASFSPKRHCNHLVKEQANFIMT